MVDAELAQTRREERELVLRFRRDPRSRDAVVRAFQPLVKRLARNYHRGEEPLEDLEQVAMVGLLKALERFDADRGSPFVTYATPTITGEIRRHYRDTGWATHVERSAKETALRLQSLDRRSAGQLTAEECADELGLTVEQVVSGRLAMQAMRAGSLAPASPEEPEPIIAGRVDTGYEAAENRATIAALTRELPVRERRIVALRFGAGLTQAEIGTRVGLSQMHVSRILRQVLDRLALEV